VQTQVLPYMRELVKGGNKISLLTFEPAPFSKYGQEEARLREVLDSQKIEWHWLPYHKRFSVLATAWDVVQGARFVWRKLRTDEIEILHARVHVPALMAALARKFSGKKPKLLFDIRGFMLEEYTDAGVWPEGGWLYRVGKRIERWLMEQSDGFVVLTEAAREILFPESKPTGFDRQGRPVEVIPCCVDLSRFEKVSDEYRDQMRTRLGVEDRKVLAYVGSFGGWYLSDEMMDFFSVARDLDPKTFVMILTQRDTAKVVQGLKDRGFEESDFVVDSVGPESVPDYLSAADVSVSFIKPCYSKLSSSPTKLAEYLACGLPIISNTKIGDVDALIQDNGVGVLITDLTVQGYIEALDKGEHLGGLREHCKTVGRNEFDLQSVGGGRYRRLYERLSERVVHK